MKTKIDGLNKSTDENCTTYWATVDSPFLSPDGEDSGKGSGVLGGVRSLDPALGHVHWEVPQTGQSSSCEPKTQSQRNRVLFLRMKSC